MPQQFFERNDVHTLFELTLGPTEGDIMEISGGVNVFVHKCEFVNSTDESLSIVRGSDFVTVSWCKFHFTEPHSHAFGHLIDANPGEIGWAGLKFEDSSQPTFTPNKFPIFELPYKYILHPVDSVRSYVTAGAGNVFNK